MFRQVRVYIKGDVIGVGFRAWTALQAGKHGVKGWVKNAFDRPHIFGPNGGVEALLQADEQALTKMIGEIKTGSSTAEVEDVIVNEEEPDEIYQSFEIIR